MSESNDRPPARIPGVVLPPDVFADRLAVLTKTVEEAGLAQTNVAATSLPVAIRHARRLHQLWGDVAPPTLEPRPGLRGRMVHFVQRIVRRCTWWYIEPRWTGQREFDAVAARFATETTRAIDALSSNVQELREINDRLARQVYELQLRVTEAGDSPQRQSAVEAPGGAEA